ncbi:hypothetical protein XOCgx_1544 [Xanthomonas oryzae pv. oryzicola]|nr:hypothetical protein XOCgx_1544 [Xanthomonas oryzae pv. oryzicola]
MRRSICRRRCRCSHVDAVGVSAATIELASNACSPAHAPDF